jgi:starch-binding outer membrane protein, SusD/RagB family
MKRNIFIILGLLISWSCNDEEFLSVDPTDMLQESQVFGDEKVVLSVVSDLYARYPESRANNGDIRQEYQAIDRNVHEHADFNEAFSSQDYNRHGNSTYDFAEWGWWNYAYVRELNLFLERIVNATISEESKARFESEVRFLRAATYFEAVKRMGGVPLILETMSYDFSGDPSYLQRPRAKEHEVYDFIISELTAIKDNLPNNADIKDRATQGLVLAMKSRAALYAGSIARYGAMRTPQVSLPTGEVGIPADKANAYYTTALAAAEEIIAGSAGAYALYMKDPDDLSVNFASLFRDKAQNPEAIFVNDFKLKTEKRNHWTLENQPRSMSEDGVNGGRVNPSLNFVQSFELIQNNEFAPLPIKDALGNYIYYENPLDLFAGRDARLAGTVMLPGSNYRGAGDQVDIFAGVYLPLSDTKISADQPGAVRDVQGTPMQVVGFDGPLNGFNFTAQTGFLIRKYIDIVPGAGQIQNQSDVWYIRYRFGEVLLNAAEAAFELGNPDLAAQYLNQIRRRAGFTTDLTASDITFDRIVHERRMELAFEGHELWDMKRWRIAHLILNGEAMTADQLTQNIGSATKVRTQAFGLWPYKVYNPGFPTDGDWVFDIVKPDRVTNSDEFRLGNYYSFISDDIRNRNPLIVTNPNQ